MTEMIRKEELARHQYSAEAKYLLSVLPTIRAIELEKIREEADKLCAKDSAPDDYKIGISDLLKAIGGSEC